MRRILVACALLASCSPGHLIKKQLTLADKQLQDHTGFYLYDWSAKKILIDFNGSKYFTPASNTKIFTFYTSLRLLGDSAVALKYVQQGDSLIFQGMGDPSFLYSEVFNDQKVYNFLKSRPGNLFLSTNNFQTERLGAGWAWDDYNAYYSAERFSFPIYGNLTSIKRTPQGILSFQPSRFSSDFHISDEMHAVEEVVRDVDSNRLIFFNGIKKANAWTVPFRTGGDLVADLLSDTLHRNVDEINMTLPKNAATIKSISADSLYKVMMQASDNFIAEQLLLQCAAIVSDTLKPEIAIEYSKKNFLADLPDAPQWVDGSGLSRYNLFTPRSIVALWKKIYETIPQERLFKLLAVGGKTGTLKNGYKTDQPYIFGKTGSLSNNRCLSGFLLTKKNKIFIFSYMNNNFVAAGSEVRKKMEIILKDIHDNY